VDTTTKMSKRSFSEVDADKTSFAKMVGSFIKRRKTNNAYPHLLQITNQADMYFLTIHNIHEARTRCAIYSTPLRRSDEGDVCNSCGYWYRSDRVRIRVWGRSYTVCSEKCLASYRHARRHELIVRTFLRASRPFAVNLVNRCTEHVIFLLLQYFPRDVVALCLGWCG